MLEPFITEIEVDTTYVLYPDAKDVETLVNKKRGEEFTMGLLPNGCHCVKSITYKGGYGINARSAEESISTIKKNEKLLNSIWRD